MIKSWDDFAWGKITFTGRHRTREHESVLTNYYRILIEMVIQELENQNL